LVSTHLTILNIIVKHAFWVLLFAVSVPLIVGIWTAGQPRVYETSATILIELGNNAANTLGKNVETFDPYGNYFNNQELMETEFHIIRSMHVAKQVLADAGLDMDRDYINSVFPGVPPEKVSSDALAASIRDHIKVEPIKGTHLTVVKFEDTDPVRAQRLVTTVINTYTRLSNEEVGGATGAALAYLTEQLGKLRSELETSEMSLHDFKLNRNLISVSLNDQSNMLREEIGAFNQAVTAAGIRRAQLTSRATALAKVTTQNPDEVPAAEFLNNEVLQRLRGHYQQARADLENLRGLGKMDSHPEVVSTQGRLLDGLRAFIAEVRNLQAAATREATVAAAEVIGLQALLDSAKSRALDLNLQEIEYNRLNRATSTNEKLYQNVLERMKEVDLSRMVNGKVIKTLEAPMLPGSPIRPKMSVNLTIGAFAGLTIGLLMAFLRDWADRTVKSPADIESKLGLTSLGLLPESNSIKKSRNKSGARRKRGTVSSGAEEGPELLAHRNPKGTLAEAVRTIRSNILFMSPDHPPRTILVTSAAPGEGKTTSATSLAITFAQAGSRTLIVDLDLRRPRLHRIFRTSSEKGITTMLLGDTLESAVHETQVPNLSVLPAGPIPPNPAELLISAKMKDLIKELSSKYDRVIIDSPPTNPITDAIILSTVVDGTIFVVRSHKTTFDQMRHAVRSISDVKSHVLGFIFNAVNLDTIEYKYSYYYRAYHYMNDRTAERTTA